MAALEQASQLGVSAPKMTDALTAARSRDARMAHELRVLASAPIAPLLAESSVHNASRSGGVGRMVDEGGEIGRGGSDESSADEGGSEDEGSMPAPAPLAASVRVPSSVSSTATAAATPAGGAGGAAQTAAAAAAAKNMCCYNASEFAALSARALALGLRGDVAAAKVRTLLLACVLKSFNKLFQPCLTRAGAGLRGNMTAASACVFEHLSAKLLLLCLHVHWPCCWGGREGCQGLPVL